MNLWFASQQQLGYMETEPRFKVSVERPDKRGINLTTPCASFTKDLKSRQETSLGPSKIQFQFLSKKSRGKKDSTKQDITEDITSDSQANSHFPYTWSPARLTFNIYFYLFSIFISNKINET